MPNKRRSNKRRSNKRRSNKRRSNKRRSNKRFGMLGLSLIKQKNEFKGKNVLYCGMANDIFTPLVLVPHLDNIYVMDKFDSAFSSDDKTLDQQRTDIIDILTHKTKQQGYCDLPYKATILKEIREPDYFNLVFDYNGKERHLYIFSTDYRQEIWPEIIKDIDVLITIGAPFAIDRRVMERVFDNKISADYCINIINNLENMLLERIKKKFVYIPGWFREAANLFDVHELKNPCSYYKDNDNDMLEYATTYNDNKGLVVNNKDFYRYLSKC
jgi:hypothetical protein